MIIEKKFHIFEAAAGDDSRPSLKYVNILKHNPEGDLVRALVERGDKIESDLAVATNGFILAIIPVKLEDDDIPGLVSAKNLKRLMRGTRNGDITIKLGEDRIEVPGYIRAPASGESLLRYDDDKHSLRFPDFVRILPMLRDIEPAEGEDKRKDPPSPWGDPVARFCFDMRQAERLADSIGQFRSQILFSSTGRETNPYLAFRNNGKGLTPPFGLIMPMHFGR